MVTQSGQKITKAFFHLQKPFIAAGHLVINLCQLGKGLFNGTKAGSGTGGIG